MQRAIQSVSNRLAQGSHQAGVAWTRQDDELVPRVRETQPANWYLNAQALYPGAIVGPLFRYFRVGNNSAHFLQKSDYFRRRLMIISLRGDSEAKENLHDLRKLRTASLWACSNR
jgi:hypothetical protein